MLNNLMHILFVPEVTLAILAVACLMYGLFSKNNSFNKATNFATPVSYTHLTLPTNREV